MASAVMRYQQINIPQNKMQNKKNIMIFYIFFVSINEKQMLAMLIQEIKSKYGYFDVIAHDDDVL